MGVLCWSLFWTALLYVLSSFATILTRKRAGCFAFIDFQGSCYCLCSGTLPLFLMVPLIGLQRVVVVFPDHAHLPFGYKYIYL